MIIKKNIKFKIKIRDVWLRKDKSQNFKCFKFDKKVGKPSWNVVFCML